MIPGVKVHTKSKKGDKQIALESINKILRIFPGDTIIYPGHKEVGILNSIDIPDLVKNNN